MTNIKPFTLQLKPLTATEEKSSENKTNEKKFLELNDGFWVNPDHVAIITKGEKSNSSILLNKDKKSIVTLTNALPSQVARLLNIIA